MIGVINLFFKKFAWALVYSLLLISFTVYIALDTFVIERQDSAVAPLESQSALHSGANMTDGGKSDNNSFFLANENEYIVTDTTYKDSNINIEITKYREYDTSIYVAEIRISSSEYLKTAFARNIYGRNITERPSEIAENVEAVLSVNGDYYGSRERGYVIRNGTLYRAAASRDREALAIFSDGSFKTFYETDYSASDLIDDGAVHVLSFGPALIADGEITVTENDKVSKEMESNPRTAIGIIDDLHYVFVVSDGRTDESAGLKLFELAEFMQKLGATCGYNLDGGGSSTMVFNGKVINKPTTYGDTIEERGVSDIVYIG
ncbi:MAG: phosphodiester glycosidase family protein [Clostridia bacterium]|nr:phosphodiester glycosidase family protein [Clostridia bacterium]